MCVFAFFLPMFRFVVCSFAQIRSVCKGGIGHRPNQGKQKSLCPPAFQRTPNSCPIGAPWLNNNQPIALLKTNKQTKLWCNNEKLCYHCAEDFQAEHIRHSNLCLESRLKTALVTVRFTSFFQVDLSLWILLPLWTISNLTRQTLECSLHTMATSTMQNAGKRLKCPYPNKILFYFSKNVLLLPNQVPTLF